jgi:hypothetical protein
VFFYEADRNGDVRYVAAEWQRPRQSIVLDFEALGRELDARYARAAHVYDCPPAASVSGFEVLQHWWQLADQQVALLLLAPQRGLPMLRLVRRRETERCDTIESPRLRL